MALKSRDVYSALEDIVGPEYISEELAILDSYAFQWGAEFFTGTSFFPRAAAVLLPKGTEEIQAIVKVCNKYQIRYKAFSTGWGLYSALGLDENAIQLDLRRMNRIIEINEKGLYAVVEPYVICSQLQAELMKRGFHNNIIGAGCNTSAMPIVAHQGMGQSGVSTSYGDRNVLAVEWILPDGEVLRLGSLGSGSGWFCGDGPGPSLRGILRGPQTPMGGMGIFTKAATKIYHWPGPPKFEIEGNSPDYRLKEMPHNFNIHYPLFPSWDQLIEAGLKIAESNIAIHVSRLALPMVAQGLTNNNDDGAELLGRLQQEAKGRPGFVVTLGSDSAPEMRYREKVLRQIMSETGSDFLSHIEREDVKKEYLWEIIRVTVAVREVFRATGRFSGSLGNSASYRVSTRHMLEAEEIKKDYQAKKLIRADEGPDCMWSVPIESGHTGHAEQLVQVHPTGKSWESLMAFKVNSEDVTIKKHYPAPVSSWGDKAHDKLGPHMMNYHLWLRKIKKAFDPQGVSEPAMYISAKDK